jgi:hypothetical protein
MGEEFYDGKAKLWEIHVTYTRLGLACRTGDAYYNTFALASRTMEPAICITPIATDINQDQVWH